MIQLFYWVNINIKNNIRETWGGRVSHPFRSKKGSVIITVALSLEELAMIYKIMEKEHIRSRSEAVRLLIRRGYAYTLTLDAQQEKEEEEFGE